MLEKTDACNITGVILAGGQARRMGGQDKGLVKLNNKPMIEYVIERLRPQVDEILINANRNLENYAEYGFNVVVDKFAGYHGPLAGMVSALDRIKTPYLLTVPCDSPFIASQLADRLMAAMATEKTDISVAHTGDRMQPVFCLMKKQLQSSINVFLENGERKIDKWFQQHPLSIVDFSDIAETFDNINTIKAIQAIETN